VKLEARAVGVTAGSTEVPGRKPVTRDNNNNNNNNNTAIYPEIKSIKIKVYYYYYYLSPSCITLLFSVLPWRRAFQIFCSGIF
jgi:hypothetical protein